jgi:two-component system sensor histidine kinase/response regulator
MIDGIKPSYEELEKRVHELELDKRRIEELKTNFLANISHELKTPLNGIIASTELAISECSDDNILKYLEITQNSGHVLLGLINNVLSFAQIEKGDLDIDVINFRLDDLMDNLSFTILTIAKEKDIELLIDIPTDIPRALIGDRNKIKNILEILLDNAIKFTDSNGAIAIGVIPEQIEDNKVELTFYVKDDGIGISKKDIDEIFKPFTQIDDTHTRKYEGSGIGLGLAIQLVDLMMGKMWVDSEINKGSIFYFTLELLRQPPQNEISLIFPEGLDDLSIMIVDDNIDALNIVESIVSGFGFKCKSFASSSNALNYLKEHHDEFDILFTDWRMKEPNGLELSRQIRQELELNIPIVIISAFARNKEISTAKELKINAFLQKPIQRAELFNAIIDIVGKRALEKQEYNLITKASMYKKRLNNVHILVVEDNPTNQKIAEKVLTSGNSSIAVSIAENGLVALDYIDKIQELDDIYDAILMDVQMPKMNGYDATKAIRQNLSKSINSIPIIAMTAHTTKGEDQKCYSAGMDDFITKPIDQNVLFYTLWKHIKYKNRITDIEPPKRSISKVTQTTTTTQPECVIFEEHYGIDMKCSMSDLGLDLDTYKYLLDEYVKNSRKIVKNILQSYEDKDWKNLDRQGHSLKGSSSSLGIFRVKELAVEVEKIGKLNGKHPNPESILENLKTEYQRALASIHNIVNDNTPVAEPIDADKVLEALDNLKSAIKSSDPILCNKRLSELYRLMKDDGFLSLANYIQDYEYDNALRKIDDIASDLPYTL